MDIGLERLFHAVKDLEFSSCDPEMGIEILFYVEDSLVASVKI